MLELEGIDYDIKQEIKHSCILFLPKEIYISYEGEEFTNQNIDFTGLSTVLVCGSDAERLMSDIKMLDKEFPKGHFTSEEEKKEYADAMEEIFNDHYNGMSVRVVELAKIIDDNAIVGGHYDRLDYSDPMNPLKNNIHRKWDFNIYEE